MSAVLEISNLTIGFKVPVFTNMTASMKAGTITALMGVNGAGKSCLIKTLGHLIDPLSGQIKLNGKNLEDYAPKEFAQLVSMVLTEKIQADYLRVGELVALGRSPYTNWTGELLKEDRDIIDEVIKLIGLTGLTDKFFSELSDGQKQRVLIARALAQRPKLLILDEPTTYLDIPSKIELIKLLKKISTVNNVAILLSTHDLDLIQKKVDQIWLMGSEGDFVSGSPEEIRSSGLLKKYFYLDDE